MSRRRPLALGLLVVVLSCSDDDDDAAGGSTATVAVTPAPSLAATSAAASSQAGPAMTPAPTPASSAQQPLATTGQGEVPDPCALVAAATLSEAQGSDVGTGTLAAPVPDQRKVCMYDDGTILAVEVAENWDGSLDAIRSNLGDDAIVTVEGLGGDAYWQAVGGDTGQLLVLDDDYFVGVMLSNGGQAEATIVATAMVDAMS